MVIQNQGRIYVAQGPWHILRILVIKCTKRYEEDFQERLSNFGGIKA